jgi:hypothetical protein
MIDGKFKSLLFQDEVPKSGADVVSGTSDIKPSRLIDKKDFIICEEDVVGLQRTASLPLKGLVPLNNFRFRVQVNSFMSERRKFSRNCTNIIEALWIFEVCILISDAPANLDHMLMSGNFASLCQLRDIFFMFESPLQYFVALGRWVRYFFKKEDVFPTQLMQLAVKVSFTP